MLGLCKYFYNVNPFKDNKNPTVAKVDYWNIEVICHFQNLFGIMMPVEPDECLFAIAHFNDKQKYSQIWDEKYPENKCFRDNGKPKPNAPHCGA
jgi:hypothetical protein